MTDGGTNEPERNITAEREFVAARLDEIIHEFESDAPENPQHHEGSADGPLAIAQRHRAQIDTAEESEIADIVRAHPEISQAWRDLTDHREDETP